LVILLKIFELGGVFGRCVCFFIELENKL